MRETKNSNVKALVLGITMEQPGASRNRIAVLDGYRALAILSVLAFHYTIRWAAPYDPRAHLPFGNIFNGFIPFEYGWLGVEFFFVIPGFVIFTTLERCLNIGDFVCRRFAPLWPALLAAATLTTVVISLTGPTDWLVKYFDYVTSISLVDPSFVSGLLNHPGIKWVDGAYWSLWVEIRFYAWAAVAYLALRSNFVRFCLMFQLAVAASALVLPHHGFILCAAGFLSAFPHIFPTSQFGFVSTKFFPEAGHMSWRLLEL